MKRNMVMQQPNMEQILQAKKWGTFDSINKVEKLPPISKIELCTIFVDAKGNQPGVFKVSSDVFKGQPDVFGTLVKEIETILGTQVLESDQEFMACLRQSQIDKKNGRTRKYEDIARECGLRL